MSAVQAAAATWSSPAARVHRSADLGAAATTRRARRSPTTAPIGSPSGATSGARSPAIPRRSCAASTTSGPSPSPRCSPGRATGASWTRTWSSTPSTSSGPTWSGTAGTSRTWSGSCTTCRTSLTHELGHLIGLDHNCYDPAANPRGRPDDHEGNPVPNCDGADAHIRAATMYNSAAKRDVSKRDLTEDDIQAVCDVYPVGFGRRRRRWRLRDVAAPARPSPRQAGSLLPLLGAAVAIALGSRRAPPASRAPDLAARVRRDGGADARRGPPSRARLQLHAEAADGRLVDAGGGRDLDPAFGRGIAVGEDPDSPAAGKQPAQLEPGPLGPHVHRPSGRRAPGPRAGSPRGRSRRSGPAPRPRCPRAGAARRRAPGPGWPPPSGPARPGGGPRRRNGWRGTPVRRNRPDAVGGGGGEQRGPAELPPEAPASGVPWLERSGKASTRAEAAARPWGSRTTPLRAASARCSRSSRSAGGRPGSTDDGVPHLGRAPGGVGADGEPPLRQEHLEGAVLAGERREHRRAGAVHRARLDAGPGQRARRSWSITRPWVGMPACSTSRPRSTVRPGSMVRGLRRTGSRVGDDDLQPEAARRQIGQQEAAVAVAGRGAQEALAVERLGRQVGGVGRQGQAAA